MIPRILTSFAIACVFQLVSSSPLAPLTSRSTNSPVITTNFQDPSILHHSNTFYAFSAPNGNPPINVQLATSIDFTTWTLHPSHDILPNPGPWTATPPHVWAPDINRLPTGAFILYYTATAATSPSQHCISAALSTNITGPYTPLSAPIACDLSTGGSIDPDLFIDSLSGNLYLVYKVDGNSIATSGGACRNGNGATPTPILLQRVGEDGHTLLGPPVEILTNIPADGAGIEAPSLFYDVASSLYVLMYNAGCFVKTGYRIEYATAADVLGPYVRRGTLVKTGETEGDIQLPGGIDVLGSEDAGGRVKAVLHGDLNMGWFSGEGARVRGMYAVQLDVGGGVVSLAGLL